MLVGYLRFILLFRVICIFKIWFAIRFGDHLCAVAFSGAIQTMLCAADEIIDAAGTRVFRTVIGLIAEVVQQKR